MFCFLSVSLRLSLSLSFPFTEGHVVAQSLDLVGLAAQRGVHLPKLRLERLAKQRGRQRKREGEINKERKAIGPRVKQEFRNVSDSSMLRLSGRIFFD